MRNDVRLDYKIISGIIAPASRVLDLGCGDGELMQYLLENNDAKVQGIEVDENAISECILKGLSVYHSDIDSGLASYPDKSFDYSVLNQSIQQVKKVDFVIQEALRVAGKAIIGFPNFAQYKSRLMLLLKGRSPVTESLPYYWHNTPNLRFLSINDFRDYAKQKGLCILEEHDLSFKNEVKFMPNLFAKDVIFVISK